MENKEGLPFSRSETRLGVQRPRNKVRKRTARVGHDDDAFCMYEGFLKKEEDRKAALRRTEGGEECNKGKNMVENWEKYSAHFEGRVRGLGLCIWAPSRLERLRKNEQTSEGEG
jgi:hypothetical protein